MMLHPWVLGSTVEVHWPLNVLRGSLPPPLLSMVLAQVSNSRLMSRISKPLFWPKRVATTLHTVEGSREPTPSIPAWMSLSSWKLTRVPSEPLVSPSLYLRLLLELCFPGHPQPWSLRKYDGDFELAATPPFESHFSTQKAQFSGPGCPGSDQSTAVYALVLLDLDQKLLVSA
jgi:hypothetical protein